MIQRIGDIEKELPITFIYGSRTWMDRECGNQSKYLRPDSRVDVEVRTMFFCCFFGGEGELENIIHNHG